MSNKPKAKKPRRLHNYDIIDIVGQGGMATVYKAMQKTLHRIVAIKELHAAIQAEGVPKKRFEREAVAVASMSHENIVGIYDFFEHDDNRYLVMEYVGGVSLEEIMQKCRVLPIDIVVMIMLQVVRALEYTHAMGLVHRDIKPSNIMVTHDGVVKLMDFGVVHTTHWENLTVPGTFIGTPRYMSPEQIKGNTVDFRSDLFSTGIIFYELITGMTLFDGSDKTEILQKIIRRSIRRPSRVRPGLPGVIQRAIMRCLRRDPRKRYPTTQQLRRLLEQFLGNQNLLTMRQRISLFLKEKRCVRVDDTELLPAMGPELAKPLFTAHFMSWWVGPERFGFWRSMLAATAVSVLAAFCLWWQVPTVASGDNAKAVGGLKVVATPWARVYVNGRLREVTPFEQPIAIHAGYNRVILEHPSLGRRGYEVALRQGELVTLAIDFRGFAKSQGVTP